MCRLIISFKCLFFYFYYKNFDHNQDRIITILDEKVTSVFLRVPALSSIFNIKQYLKLKFPSDSDVSYTILFKALQSDKSSLRCVGRGSGGGDVMMILDKVVREVKHNINDF